MRQHPHLIYPHQQQSMLQRKNYEQRSDQPNQPPKGPQHSGDSSSSSSSSYRTDPQKKHIYLPKQRSFTGSEEDFMPSPDPEGWFNSNELKLR